MYGREKVYVGKGDDLYCIVYIGSKNGLCRQLIVEGRKSME